MEKKLTMTPAAAVLATTLSACSSMPSAINTIFLDSSEAHALKSSRASQRAAKANEPKLGSPITSSQNPATSFQGCIEEGIVSLAELTNSTSQNTHKSNRNGLNHVESDIRIPYEETKGTLYFSMDYDPGTNSLDDVTQFTLMNLSKTGLDAEALKVTFTANVEDCLNNVGTQKKPAPTPASSVPALVAPSNLTKTNTTTSPFVENTTNENYLATEECVMTALRNGTHGTPTRVSIDMDKLAGTTRYSFALNSLPDQPFIIQVNDSSDGIETAVDPEGVAYSKEAVQYIERFLANCLNPS